MDFSLSGRMGGPEVGARYLSGIVKMRSRFKAALASVDMPDVLTLDAELWLSGSITEYCEASFSSSAKYFKKKKALLVFFCVPKDEINFGREDQADQDVCRWLIKGFNSVELPKSAENIQFSVVRDAVNSAFVG